MGRAAPRVIHGPRPHRNRCWGRHHGVVVVNVVAFKVSVMQSRRVAAAVAVCSRSRYTGHRETFAPVPARRLGT